MQLQSSGEQPGSGLQKAPVMHGGQLPREASDGSQSMGWLQGQCMTSEGAPYAISQALEPAQPGLQCDAGAFGFIAVPQAITIITNATATA